MTADPSDVLIAAAGLTALGAAPAATQTPAEPGQFSWLDGNWRIAHRRLKAPGDWDVFEGEATCWSILGGRAHVEELRIPVRDFSGMGLRTLDPEAGVWLDYWMNAKVGKLGGAGVAGRFIGGDGVFDSAAADEQGPMIVRGLWDQITGTSHRWRQGVSRDGGASWDWNWIMEWTRA
ncbi:hypothetical protein [Brevundimonas bacteroides]|uniref:hypothetical protein n=1 Tax=Brevundimonas bacteroides TaxID=74311 RepID=UPI00068DA6B4|nr:hypothetical protein [Brevundimonas bacteroides]